MKNSMVENAKVFLGFLFQEGCKKRLVQKTFLPGLAATIFGQTLFWLLLSLFTSFRRPLGFTATTRDQDSVFGHLLSLGHSYFRGYPGFTATFGLDLVLAFSLPQSCLATPPPDHYIRYGELQHGCRPDFTSSSLS